MAETCFQKDPNERLDYDIEWAADLVGGGETIQSAVWTINPSGELTTDLQVIAGTRTKIWLSGGSVVAPGIYRVTCRMTTNQTRVFERSFKVQILDK